MLTLTINAHDANVEKLLLWVFEQWPAKKPKDYAAFLKRAADWIGRLEDAPLTDTPLAPDLGIRALGILRLADTVELRVRSSPRRLDERPQSHLSSPPAASSLGGEQP